MQISIIVRQTSAQWGGDLTVINQLIAGMKSIGIDAQTESNNIEIKKNKKYFITNTCLNQTKLFDHFSRIGKEYYCLPFHEDFRKYYTQCIGMVNIASNLLSESNEGAANLTIEELELFPDLPNYSNAICPTNGIANRHGLERSAMSFPSSLQEAKTIVRESPRAKVTVAMYPTNVGDRFNSLTNDTIFTDEYKIPKNYMLQVGRLEPRKNQIATILATRDIPLPLVLIASAGYSKQYNELAIKAILKYRKHPTYIISQDLPELSNNMLKIIRMKDGKKLDWETLHSAYLNCSVNIHPAYYELPGLTYIESIQLKKKTIISENASIHEYITNHKPTCGIYFVDPSNIQDIKRKVLDAIYDRNPFSAEIISIDNEGYAKFIAKHILL